MILPRYWSLTDVLFDYLLFLLIIFIVFYALPQHPIIIIPHSIKHSLSWSYFLFVFVSYFSGVNIINLIINMVLNQRIGPLLNLLVFVFHVLVCRLLLNIRLLQPLNVLFNFFFKKILIFNNFCIWLVFHSMLNNFHFLLHPLIEYLCKIIIMHNDVVGWSTHLKYIIKLMLIIPQRRLNLLFKHRLFIF